MSPNYLATINAFADAWEAALAVLWQRVNTFVAKEGSSAELPVNDAPPSRALLSADLALLDAISKLNVAAHNMRGFHPMPENSCVLYVNEQTVFTIAHPADIDKLLHLASAVAKTNLPEGWHKIKGRRVYVPDPWKCNIIDPNVKHAETIREWLASEKNKALAAATPTHSNDFTSVDWFGTAYRFAKGLQAESVRALWEAWERKTPSLAQETIGNVAGSASDRFRLEHVFKPKNKTTGRREPHPAWGTMIRNAGKGLFALSPP